jgi:hypothetical protein
MGIPAEKNPEDRPYDADRQRPPAVLGQAGSGGLAAASDGDEEFEEYSGDGGMHAGFVDERPGGGPRAGAAATMSARAAVRDPE